ncbi:hypothetical protein [Moorena bouillonii]|uniref:hypothetical protein n=1 Tax=Moorena bouillonii TaxID=207920 RepID=UPI0018E920FD|nr:hypothetical protein [Moorena bouillonii]
MPRLNSNYLAGFHIKERLDFAKQCWKKTYYFLFITDQVDGTPTDPHLSYQLGWFPIDELPTLFWPEQQELIKTNSKLIQNSVSICATRRLRQQPSAVSRQLPITQD